MVEVLTWLCAPVGAGLGSGPGDQGPGARPAQYQGRNVSVPRARMSAMSTPLCLIGDPVLAAGPVGVRIRTRIHPSANQAAALTAIATVLGGLYRGELAGRIRLGRVDHQAQSPGRAHAKQGRKAGARGR